MEKVVRMTLLYDFYGQLLTKRQEVFTNLYYGQDYSLGEIADEYGVTRQAVHDTLKRAEKILTDFEDKLGLIEKFMSDRKVIAEALKMLRNLRQDCNADQLGRIEEKLAEITSLPEQ